jgi:hypothetical protein
MDSKLQQFINTYTGILCGDTPENKGECVGLSELWMDDLGLNTPHEYGNARDLLANANTNNFDIIYNTPTGFPLPGDIMVWGTSWGGGYGHTGVIVTADINQFTCFEQNNPTGHAPQINGHTNYNGVLGWLHPKVAIDQPTIVTPENPLLTEWRAMGETGDLPIGFHGSNPAVPLVEPTPPTMPPVVITPVVVPPVTPQPIPTTPSTANAGEGVTYTNTATNPPAVAIISSKLTFWQQLINFLKLWLMK